METEVRMKELVQRLNEASERYYNGQDEIMSNYEWDALFDELTKLEEQTGVILPDSPTHSTGAQEKGGERETHEYPALSLAKTKQIAELVKWAEGRPVFLSWKLDGLTLVATYDQGKLTKVLTRGNGSVGTNITYLAGAIYDLPLKIAYQGHLVVRGEATISYTDFEEQNAMMEEEEDRYANPRNLASGTLSLDDPAKVKERKVHFNAFTLVHVDEPMVPWGERMEFLKKQGFVTVEYIKTSATELPQAVQQFTDKVEQGEMDIPVDGLVICYEDTEYAASGSVTGHHATRAGYAFKWEDTVAESTLSYVEWSCARSTISPVAVFEPVELEGTTVSRASLCNISEMKRLGIGDSGTKIQCIKSNKIIPKVVGVLQKVGQLEIPKVCPACHAPTEIHVSKGSGTETLHCTNPACPAKNVQKFTRFVSRQGMDIDGLSIQTIIRFINQGYMKDFADIYTLSTYETEIKELDGFGEKSCDNLKASIEKSRQVHPANFIFALCIPLIGIDAAKKILKATGWKGFVERLEEGTGFEDVDGIGPEKSGSILTWYEEAGNREVFQKLLKVLAVEQVEPATNENGSLAGLTFVITGDVHSFKNRSEFKAYVESQGGSVTGSVSKKTSFLVNNDVESVSSKNKKAKDLGIPILSEDDFINRFGK
ncbi:MAG: NAD-dependent DNA ligase LigA [Lachnospiraceae bacterium]|nr:NAD-dependent DNA ligase LigA [Lachnospiraceae bacterium]